MKPYWIILILAMLGCQNFAGRLEKLQSPYSKDRAETMYWLFQNTQGPTNKKLFQEALQKDNSETVRSMAARLMALEGDQAFIPALENGLSDKSSVVRMECVQSLGSLHAYKTIPTLSNMLPNEGTSWVRLKILKTIEYLNATDTLPHLIDRLDDTDPAVKFQAMLLLEKFTGKKMGMDKESWQQWYQKNQNAKSR